jgi:hypothetical protein
MRRLNWPVAILSLLAAMALIGIWASSLLSISLATFTRESVVLFHPSEEMIAATTFLMLGGIVLLSIQVAHIIEELLKGR